ncbi:YHS domain-containing protein [Halostella salina]|uniref:YHS domain-containing protein n=1 Tax=Halostella salina TaxID=1547897 RepID=UPI000EF8151E|nr:YHS domain-containing protein [Halostella salina]
METCPVCGQGIEARNPTETDYEDEAFAPAEAEYDGETYRFCSEDCKRRFEASPEEYA